MPLTQKALVWFENDVIEVIYFEAVKNVSIVESDIKISRLKPSIWYVRVTREQSNLENVRVRGVRDGDSHDSRIVTSLNHFKELTGQ